jgi:hypothetical protein
MGTRIAVGLAAALLLSLCPANATAQSVRGHGKLDNGPGLSVSEITVDAWLDDFGFAHGSMDWIGDISNTPPYGNTGLAGPALPWHIDVTEIIFNGDTAYVVGVVTHSVSPTDIGTTVIFTFTDNSDLGLPDEIDGQPILAGNFTVDD